MSNQTNPSPDPVGVIGDTIHINDFSLSDPVVAGLLKHQEGSQRSETLGRMLSVGGRGLTSMGLGVDLDEIDRRVGRSVTDALAQGRSEVATLLEEARREVVAVFDPDRGGSLIARCLEELDGFRRELSDAIDPNRVDSHTAAVIREVSGMLGPGGALERRLRLGLDPEHEGSPLGGSFRRIEQRLTELTERWAGDAARADEAEAGTRKGFDYEDELDGRLRAWARPRRARVERTSRSEGSIAGGLVGDFLIVMPSGARIVVEAKNSTNLTLNGGTGILQEMQRARDNRGAEAGVCVSRQDAFPAEVGSLAVYEGTVLAVDGAEGVILEVALTLAAESAELSGRHGAVLDMAAVSSRLDRIRNLASQLSSQRRALTDIVASVEKIRTGLDSVRQDLLEAVADIQLATRADAGEVVPLAVGADRS